jgi:hypothetical protein
MLKFRIKWLAGAAALVVLASASVTLASGGSGGGGTSGGGGVTTPKVDSIKVSKCYIAAGSGMLIKASSSDVTATLSAYLPDGTYYGWVQNGGGSRYGGTVMPYVATDPGSCHIVSSSGGEITVPSTPFIQ